MNEIAQLREQLHTLSKETSSEEWYQSLNARKKEELTFHNRDRDQNLKATLSESEQSKFYGNKKYYTTTNRSQEYVTDWLKKYCKDKVVLDYACGDGGMSHFIAQETQASLTVGLDISDVSISNAATRSTALGLEDKVFFIQGDCERTQLPDNTFDTIYCCGMLHHLDLSYAFPELRRILKPGGRILAVEALSYNPLIKAYRMLTPDMRTDWEKKHILSLADITFAKRFFSCGDIRYWHITSMLAAAFPSEGSLHKSCLALCDTLDAYLTRVPLVQLLSWQFTFELIKADEPMNV